MPAFPTESELFPTGDLAPATAKAKFLQWLQATIGLLGSTGTAADARTALGLSAIAASGSATDLSSGTVPVARLPSATTAAVGAVELATNTEAQGGTDATRALTPSSMKAGLNASGSAPIYAARAWVRFNGTGTVAINGGGNVSSITDVGVGQYVVNFTTAMPDANYAALVTAEDGFGLLDSAGAQSTSSVRVRISNGTTSIDSARIAVVVFG